MLTSLAMIYRFAVKREIKVSKFGAGAIRERIHTNSCRNDLHSQGAWHQMKHFIISRLAFMKCICGDSKEVTYSTANPNKKKRGSHSLSVFRKGVAYSCSWLLTWLFVMTIEFRAIAGKDPQRLALELDGRGTMTSNTE